MNPAQQSLPPHALAGDDQLHASARINWFEPSTVTLNDHLDMVGYSPTDSTVTESDPTPGG